MSSRFLEDLEGRVKNLVGAVDPEFAPVLAAYLEEALGSYEGGREIAAPDQLVAAERDLRAIALIAGQYRQAYGAAALKSAFVSSLTFIDPAWLLHAYERVFPGAEF